MSDSRIRFGECEAEAQPDSQIRIRIALEDEGETFTGSVTGPAEDNGALWSAAEATVHALHKALKLGDGALALRDVVSFHIAGVPAVAVSLSTRIDGQKRMLYGLCQAEENEMRAAALAVLNGSNRMLGNV